MKFQPDPPRAHDGGRLTTAGVSVALSDAVAENSAASVERRGAPGPDRRKKSRGGRRATDPRTSWRWRRLAWLFAAYAVYWSVRSLPSTVKNYFKKTETPAS